MATELLERPTAAAPEVVVRVVGGDGGGDGRDRRPVRRRRFPWRTTGVLAAVVALAIAVGLVAQAVGRFDLHLFGSTTVDRSAPVVLKEIREVATFTAATGEFESTVDVERTIDNVPAFVAGEHTIFLGVGRVDATVDLSALGTDAVTVTGDRSVRVVLPAPRLGRAVVDPVRSHVLSRDRGVVDRVAGVFTDSPTGERALMVKAQRRIGAAAAASDLRDRAEAGTTRMVKGLLSRLGYDRVEVAFAD